MTPLEIKHALEVAGFTQAEVARRCGLRNRQNVNAVIRSAARSKVVEQLIARVIQRPLEEIWPHWYGPDARRRRRRMNTAELFARVQKLEAELQAAKAA